MCNIQSCFYSSILLIWYINLQICVFLLVWVYCPGKQTVTKVVSLWKWQKTKEVYPCISIHLEHRAFSSYAFNYIQSSPAMINPILFKEQSFTVSLPVHIRSGTKHDKDCSKNRLAWHKQVWSDQCQSFYKSVTCNMTDTDWICLYLNV